MIPKARERWQSRALVWVVGCALAAACLPILVLMTHPQNSGYWVLRAGLVSLTFAAVVWTLRAATPTAAFCGGMICLLVIVGTVHVMAPSVVRSGLMPLMLLFVLTFLSTQIGKARKVHLGVSESKRGRNATQVIANLGAAAIFAIPATLRFSEIAMPRRYHMYDAPPFLAVAMLLAALAEATADTVSSEIGAVFGGRPFLMTTLQRVEPGTDGAVSLVGTLAGVAGALLVVAAGVWTMGCSIPLGAVALFGGLVGFVFDSLLGATLERRGWLGNDWVNFSSTVCAGMVAWFVASELAFRG